MMEKVVTIGCVNFATKWEDKEANLHRIKEITKVAAEIGINIIAFPELALSG
jgi:predicted amidohydrolase